MELTPEAVKSSGGIKTIRPNEPDDLFVSCASYEPRSSSIAEYLSDNYYTKRAVLYVNTEFLTHAKTKSNLELLRKLVGQHSNAVDVAEGSSLDPKIQLEALRGALVRKTATDLSSQAITFDITTFNREALLVAVALLYSHYENLRMRALYASPVGMGPWLSRGFRTVRNVMSFSGSQDPNRHNLLVVLSGFEPERTLKIIEEHEPARVLLGIGDPPTAQTFLDRNQTDQKLILARQGVYRFTFPANDVAECQSVLESIITPLMERYNIVLAPMSTKLSTLAVFLVAARHPEIQITYSVPGEYNIDSYSTGVRRIYSYELPDLPFGQRVRLPEFKQC